jgi:hypothetical protein
VTVSGEVEPDDEITDTAITWVTSHPDGRWIAVGDFGGRILVWAPREDRIVAQQKLPARVLRVEWTRDGERLVAIAEGSDALHVLSPDGASTLRTIATRHEDVAGLAVHPSKRWAATTGGDGHVRVWDLDTGAAVLELKASSEGSVCALSEKHVAVGTRAGAFDVWEIATKKDVAGGEVFARTYVSAIAFSPDGTSLVMGGGNGRLLHLDVADKWKCTHEWKDVPPKPIATNDIRFAADGSGWVAAHSDDRASLFALPADPHPSSLGQAFWLERKPWSRDFIVSAACFVPGTSAIVTAHFTGRLRVFEKKSSLYLRVGDVVFDPESGAPKTFGPMRAVFVRPAPPQPKPTHAVAIGDREHRARSMAEMELAASLRPCTTCGASPKQLMLSGEGDTRTLRGDCPYCATPAAFTFFVEGDPATMKPRRHEVGDDRPSTMIEPRELTAELERLGEQGIDDRNRARALTCVLELLKFPLIRDGERGDGLRIARDRFLADMKDAPPPNDPEKRAQANIDTIVRALFFTGTAPTTLGALEEALGVRADVDVAKFWPEITTEVSLSGFVTKIALVPIWDIHHVRPPKDAEELRRFALTEWSVVFAGGADVFQNALRRAFGPPRIEPSCHVYGINWVVQTAGPAIKLTWAQRIPDWAHSVDAGVRERALVGLARSVSEAKDFADLVKIASSLPQGCGIVPRESTATHVAFELVPAMPMLELARAFGWPAVVGQTSDMHGSSWAVLVPTGGPDDAAVPRIGSWRIELRSERWPSGGEVPGSTRPMFRTMRFGPKDLVRRVWIGNG